MGATGAGHPAVRAIAILMKHPMHTDEVAARFPDLTIIAARPSLALAE